VGRSVDVAPGVDWDGVKWWVVDAPAGLMAGLAVGNRVGAALGALRVLCGVALAVIGDGGGV